MPGRLIVGCHSLKVKIGVRVPAWQPENKTDGYDWLLIEKAR